MCIYSERRSLKAETGARVQNDYRNADQVERTGCHFSDDL
jgi:hypothetical protein